MNSFRSRVKLLAAFVISVMSYGDYIFEAEQLLNTLVSFPGSMAQAQQHAASAPSSLEDTGDSLLAKKQGTAHQALARTSNVTTTRGAKAGAKSPAQRKKEEQDYLSHRFQAVNNPSCRNDLLACDMVYDAECFHKCEMEIFHRIESCLVPSYPLLQRAASTIPAENKTTCLLYDVDGYLRNEVIKLVSKDWPEQLVTIPYTADDRSVYKKRCYDDSKKEQRSLCFNIKQEAQVISTVDDCGGTCAADNLTKVVNDIQEDFSHTWGPFHKQQKQDTVVLIGRKSEKRNDARAFRQLRILASILRPHCNLKIYDGSTSSFSNETATIFASAKVVIGYHGAGFANMIYSHMNNNTVAIELFARGCAYEHYFNQRIAEWGFKWKQLVLGEFTNGVVNPPTAPSRPGIQDCKWVDSVTYNQAEIGVILREVLGGLESGD